MDAGSTFGRFVPALDQPCAIIVNNKSDGSAVCKQLLGETMQKKSKVVAFRVNDEEYEALTKRVNDLKQLTDNDIKTVANLVEHCLQEPLSNMVASLQRAKKNAEAAAKRKATKEAKKAANDAK